MSDKQTSAILIPWAQTDWYAEGRLVSTTQVPLSTEGEQQVARWADVIQKHRPVLIYAPEKGPGEDTAQRLVKQLRVKVKKSPRLAEVDLGLWEGLTPQQLQQRFAKAYKKWKDDPSSVCPPEGEVLADAVERLSELFDRLSRKHAGECFGLVLGPLALAALRCSLESKEFESLWGIPQDQLVKYCLNLDENKAVLIT